MCASKCCQAIMIRTKIQLEPVQFERLKALAARQSKSVAQLVREGVDQLLDAEQRESAWDRFLAAIGSYSARDGITDVSALHDAHLSDAFLVTKAPALRSEAIPGRRGAPSRP